MRTLPETLADPARDIGSAIEFTDIVMNEDAARSSDEAVDCGSHCRSVRIHSTKHRVGCSIGV
jgi:hypothetical protein